MSYNDLPPNGNYEFPILPYMHGGDFTFNYPHLLHPAAFGGHLELPADFVLPHPGLALPPVPPPAGHWSPGTGRDHMVAPELPNYGDFESWNSPEIFYNNQPEPVCAERSPGEFSYAGESPYSRADAEDKYQESSVGEEDGQEMDLKLPEGITREDLTNLGIPDLNKKLKDIGVGKMSEKELKRLRRQFKNRGYAQVCREKKNKKKNTMREQKEELEEEIEQLRADVENLKKERNRYKNQYDKIHRNKLAGFPQGTH